MDPKPDHGEESYQGSGRLLGRKALITGGTPASGGQRPLPSPAKARMLPSFISPAKSLMHARSLP
jgi:hypothetical protein